MELSIVIVNYNVKYFLEQCLYSVRQALGTVDGETIVVDNASTDGSLEYLKPLFPEVRFIENEANLGFARACNLGLSQASGSHILFLNPDTILSENTLRTTLCFFQKNKGAGAAGVRMIDGSGCFLKESKRSFPSPQTSLYKLSGLSALFPRSNIFSRYHLGHLSNDANHQVDVLAGAYMLIRKEVLDQVGSFDETFFMYGEDVDLSYRIQKAGYENYFIADTQIIHFKGESTKRGSLNYVRMFYYAMSQFVKKHYGGTKAGVFNLAIHLAIWLRAFLAAVGKFIRRIGLSFIDAILILLSFWMAKELWVEAVRPDIQFPEKLLNIALPAFTVLYLVVAYYAGLYNRYYRQSNLTRSTLIATLVLLAAYALLPEDYRFSRGVVVFGALFSFLLISGLRLFLVKTKVLYPSTDANTAPHILIVGSQQEYEDVRRLYPEKIREKIIGRVSADQTTDQAVATLEDMNDVIRGLNAYELVFCIGTLRYEKVIELIQGLPKFVRLRFHAAGSHSIVGSDSSTASGEVITKESFNLEKPGNQRVKRLVDLLIALFGLVLWPLTAVLVRQPFRFWANCVRVLLAQRTWIGYASPAAYLPRLRTAVLAANGLPAGRQTIAAESLHLIDYWYAKEYTPSQDLKLIVRNLRNLGSGH